MTGRTCRSWIWNGMAVAFVVTSILLLSPESSLAARLVPPPVSILLERGYGYLYAEVVSAQNVKLDPTAVPGSVHYRVVLRLKQILAQPVLGTLLPLKSGDTFQLTVSTGYGAQAEVWGADVSPIGPDGPLRKCANLLLSVRFDGATRIYELVDGAGAVTTAQTLPGDLEPKMNLIRRLLLLPPDKRILECEQIIKSFTAQALQKGTALSELQLMVSSIYSTRTTDKLQKERVVRLLKEIWSIQAVKFPQEWVRDLDYTLKSALPNDFPDSELRYQVLISRAFAPLNNRSEPQFDSELKDREEQLHALLGPQSSTRTVQLADRYCREIQDDAWPMPLRICMFRRVQALCQGVEHPEQRWIATLTQFRETAGIALSDVEPKKLTVVDGSPTVRDETTILFDHDQSSKRRMEALESLSRRAGNTGTYYPTRLALQATLKRFWKTASFDLNPIDLSQCDCFLVAAVPGFSSSQDRASILLDRLLNSFPRFTDEDKLNHVINERGHLSGSRLEDILVRHPVAADRVIHALTDDKLPLKWRVRLAGGLTRAYRTINTVPSSWEPALQAFYLSAIKKLGPDFELGQTMAQGLWPSEETQRTFKPNQSCLAAIRISLAATPGRDADKRWFADVLKSAAQ